MDIEVKATSAIKDAIASTDILSPFINEHDKEPSWDGFIYIYSNKKKCKDGLKRVPVQVKGTVKSKIPKKEIKYEIETVDLKNYLDDGGVLYFVVYISPRGDRNQIYFASLLPVKIRSLLEQANNKKTVKIKCSPLPLENEALASIFINFHRERQSQSSFANYKLYSVEELENEGLLDELKFSVSGYGDYAKNSFNLLFQDDLYMYATVKGIDIPIPVNDVISNVKSLVTLNETVTVQDNTFYNSCKAIYSKNKTEYIVGSSFSLSLSDDKKIFKMDLSDYLDEQVIDIEFFLALYNNCAFSIGSSTVELNKIQIEYPSERIETLEKQLAFCQKTIMLFDKLGIDSHFDLSELEIKDYRNLERLEKAIIDNAIITDWKPGLPLLLKLNVSNLSIPLVLKEEEGGNYRVSDFVRDNTFELIREVDGDNIPTTRFAILNPQDYVDISSMDYNCLIESVLLYEKQPTFYDESNRILLHLINAYDLDESRQDTIKCAEKLSKILVEKANETNKEIAVLNNLQIKKRLGSLLEEDVQHLKKIADNVRDPVDNRIAAHLLLDEPAIAKILLGNSSDSTQEKFKSYPIVRFLVGDDMLNTMKRGAENE